MTITIGDIAKSKFYICLELTPTPRRTGLWFGKTYSGTKRAIIAQVWRLCFMAHQRS